MNNATKTFFNFLPAATEIAYKIGAILNAAFSLIG